MSVSAAALASQAEQAEASPHWERAGGSENPPPLADGETKPAEAATAGGFGGNSCVISGGSTSDVSSCRLARTFFVWCVPMVK